MAGEYDQFLDRLQHLYTEAYDHTFEKHEYNPGLPEAVDWAEKDAAEAVYIRALRDVLEVANTPEYEWLRTSLAIKKFASGLGINPRRLS